MLPNGTPWLDTTCSKAPSLPFFSSPGPVGPTYSQILAVLAPPSPHNTEPAQPGPAWEISGCIGVHSPNFNPAIVPDSQRGPMIGENRQLVTNEPVEVQVWRKITYHFRIIYRIYPNLMKENWRMSTCNRLDLRTLGSQLVIMPKNLCDHWRGHFTHEPRAVTMRLLWEPNKKCPKAVPTHLQKRVVWSRTLECSVKSYVTGTSTTCYFSEFFSHVGSHTW